LLPPREFKRLTFLAESWYDLAMALSNAAKAGALFFVGTAQFTIVWFLSESWYPNYNVANNYISDLGTNCSSSGTCYVPPEWWVFNSSAVILGLLLMLGAYYWYRSFRWRPAFALLTLAGIGLVGLGVFNETYEVPHLAFSLLVFLSLGLSAVILFRFQKSPLSYFSLALGLVTLVAIVLYTPDTGVYFGGQFGIGPGGLERLIVYPMVVWGLGFAGQLMASEE
jgi:hypothetical membrane protein